VKEYLVKYVEKYQEQLKGVFTEDGEGGGASAGTATGSVAVFKPKLGMPIQRRKDNEEEKKKNKKVRDFAKE
jgi:hypothetical protein